MYLKVINHEVRQCRERERIISQSNIYEQPVEILLMGQFKKTLMLSKDFAIIFCRFSGQIVA